MRRVLPVLLMVVLFALGILFGATRAPLPSPEAAPAGERSTKPVPASEERRPRARLVVRRAVVPAPVEAGAPAPEPPQPLADAPADEPVADTADDAWRDEAMGFMDLPEDARARLGDAVMSRLDALEDACDHLFPSGETPVMLAMTLDDRGLLRLEVSSWSGDAAVADPRVALPTGLRGCLDDAVWAEEWPTHTEPVAMALTVPFTRD